MKLKLLILSAILLALFTGCTKEELNQSDLETFNVTISASTEEDKTRSSVADNGYFTWNKNDKVAVYVTGGAGARFAEFILNSGAGTHQAIFNGSLLSGESISDYAIYPYSAKHKFNNDILTVNMAKEYGDFNTEYAENTNAPMVANVTQQQEATAGRFIFNHLGGVLKFTVKNVPVGAAQFVFTANTGITGDFAVEKENNEMVIKTKQVSDNDKITIKFKPLTSSASLNFYIPLPVGEYKGFSFTINKADGTLLSKYSTQTSNTLTRKMLAKYPELSVSTVGGDISDDYIAGVTLNKQLINLYTEESEQLRATVKQEDNGKTIIWSSENPEIATVTQDGYVTAIKAGETTIKATLDGKSAVCKVVVSTRPENIADKFDPTFANFLYLCNYIKNPQVIYEEDVANIKEINEEQHEGLYDFEFMPDVKSLKGIEYLKSLEILYIYSTDFIHIDVSNNSNLKYLSIDVDNVQELDLSKNTELEYLVLGKNSNQLISLNISNNKKLKVLDVEYCNLSSLDLRNNVNLRYLNCGSNNLTSLDLSNNKQLLSLYCAYNQLTKLDVSNCQNLQTLYCSSNPLTELNVSNCVTLQDLDFNYTSLTELNVSGCVNLQRLKCFDNQLTELNLSGCINLLELDCSNNQLTGLDISTNRKLRTFDCDGNRGASTGNSGEGQQFQVKAWFDNTAIPEGFTNTEWPWYFNGDNYGAHYTIDIKYINVTQ